MYLLIIVTIEMGIHVSLTIENCPTYWSYWKCVYANREVTYTVSILSFCERFSHIFPKNKIYFLSVDPYILPNEIYIINYTFIQWNKINN